MAVKIRLTRKGTKKRPFYRVVVADSRSPRDGRVIDTIGFYDPISKTEPYRIDGTKAVNWLKEGAELTDTARSLLRRSGIIRAWREGGTGEGLGASLQEPAADTAAAEAPPTDVSAPEAPAEPEAPEKAAGAEEASDEAPSEEPASDEASAEEPASEEPVAEEPASEEPVADAADEKPPETDSAEG